MGEVVQYLFLYKKKHHVVYSKGESPSTETEKIWQFWNGFRGLNTFLEGIWSSKVFFFPFATC